MDLDKPGLVLIQSKERLTFNYMLSIAGHIGPESRLFAVKSTSAETGMGMTSRP